MKKNIIIILILLLSVWTVNLKGAGSYSIGGPPNPPTPTYITANISSPIPFADWWTSVITRQNSDVLIPFPLSFKILNSGGENYGLAVWYPGIGQFNDIGNLDSVTTSLSPEIYIRAEGWNQNNLTTRADGYSDWSVKLQIEDGTSKINYVTLVKGCPFFYIETENCDTEEFYFSSAVTKTSTTNSTNAGLSTSNPVTNDHLMFHTGDKHYAVFSFPGTVFQMINTNKIHVSNFSNYLSVAIISNENDLNTFYQSAYAYISDTDVSYSYNEGTSEMTITYNINTTLKRAGFSDVPLICLFPHHYKHSSATLLSIEYPTVRGNLKLFKGKSFNTILKFEGILPFFTEPFNTGYSRATLQTYINTMKAALTSIGFTRGDTYFSGKGLARASSMISIANEIGDSVSRDYFINTLKAELEEWFTVGGDMYYCYFNNWGTMIGHPVGFGSDTQLNDHHFHHGYFIYSSAILSMFDASFISDYGWLVEHLIRDVNCPNRADTEYAFLNYLDIYEGHSWASGIAQFNDGNNQESSSEAMNYWIGVYLWGLITGNNTYRDLGIFGYVLENSGIDEYWFDKDKNNFHPDYRAQNVMTCLVWGGKYDHNIWWSPKEMEFIHGILWLPITPSSLYLAYHPWYAKENYDDMVNKNGGPEDRWYDIIWKYQSFFDPDAAITKFNNNPGLVTGVDWDAAAGNSTAEVYNFMHNMKSLGRIDTNYYADFSAFNVFTNNNGFSNDITYMAYNPTGSFKNVKFYKNGSLEYTLSNIPPYRVWSSKSIAPVNWPPVASFWISDVTGLKKIFYATNSSDYESDPIYYAWDVDGDSNIDINFSINRSIITNNYSTSGTNNVTLWVTDLSGTNSLTKICCRTGTLQQQNPPGGEVPDEKPLVSIGTNIKKSITFPNPFYLNKDNVIKFGIYENSILKGFPPDTIVLIYNITGDLIWQSGRAENYEYNIIRADKNIFQENDLQNEILICLVKNSVTRFRFKLLVLK